MPLNIKNLGQVIHDKISTLYMSLNIKNLGQVIHDKIMHPIFVFSINNVHYRVQMSNAHFFFFGITL